MAVAAIVQAASANTTTDPATVTLGATPTVGNTLLAIMASDTTIQTGVTAGAGRSYTQRLAQVNAMGFYVWTRLVVSGDAAATSFDITGANPACLMVYEVSGTYDTIGTGATTVGANGTTRTTTTLTPASVDNLVFAVAGNHSTIALTTAGSADNGFTFDRRQASASTGSTQCNLVVCTKATGATTATGTTTVSWTGTASDRDGVQVAFTGLAGGSPATIPDIVMSQRAW